MLKIVGPWAKLLLNRYWLISRPMTLGVRCAAFTHDDQICLVRHTYVEGWFLPGGGVDPGETIYQAAERELREETGIVLQGTPELRGFYANPKVSRRDHVALLVCHDWRQGPYPKPNLEIAEVSFFPTNQLPDATTDSTRRRIAELRGHCKAAHQW